MLYIIIEEMVILIKKNTKKHLNFTIKLKIKTIDTLPNTIVEMHL